MHSDRCPLNAATLGIMLAALLASAPLCAERAALLMDIGNGGVLHAENALRPSYPASLTKLMTLYLLFEAVKRGRYSGTSELSVSAAAAAQAPVSLHLKAGDSITVDDAINALIVMSANDVAVVVAEALGGSHPQFVDLMNATAARLGMTRTTFHNAHGLPHAQQTTTARDMAILAKALFDDYPDDYARFATLTFSFRGRSINSHNNFLRGFPGAQGLKTGFTCKAGFNLVATASRETRHLVGVVLGDGTAAARDARMIRLMRAGFAGHRKLLFNIDSFPATPAQGSGALINTQMIAEECINPQHGRSHTVVSEWGIQLGVEATREAALDRARGFIKRHRALLKGGRPLLTPRWVQNVIYEVGITDLKKADATKTCLTVRNDTVYCVARSPEAQQYAMDKALRVLAAVAKREAARHCTSGPCAAATDSARDQ